ncbi:MAG: 50S ribosomal protein L7ae-like protein [Ruminococcaceae bacterium]|nr:50S ribosomal protein L7ae-like protein [Oscillospiraceae bacterium]
MLSELSDSKIQVGVKQTLKAIDKGIVLKLFVALDADPSVTALPVKKCRELGIEIKEVPSSSELGRACNIKIAASMAVIVK